MCVCIIIIIFTVTVFVCMRAGVCVYSECSPIMSMLYTCISFTGRSVLLENSVQMKVECPVLTAMEIRYIFCLHVIQ